MKIVKLPSQVTLRPFFVDHGDAAPMSRESLIIKSKKELPEQSYIASIPKSEVGALSNYIAKQIMNGFRPRWYVVLHLNRYRYDPCSPEFESDQLLLRDVLFRLIYGNKWKHLSTHPRSANRRARCIWTSEWGKGKDRPHVNLLLEDLKYPFNTQQSLEALFGWVIPAHVKCVWKKAYDVQPIHFDTIDNLIRYVSKEADFSNKTFNPHLSDTCL